MADLPDMKTRYDSDEDGMPPINLLAFERWFSALTAGMTLEEKSKHGIIIEAYLGCQDCVCARVHVGPNEEGYVPSGRAC